MNYDLSKIEFQALKYALTRVAKHGKSVNKNNTMCVYFGDGGKRCGVGWLLKSESRNRIENASPVRRHIENNGRSSFISRFNGLSLHFLESLQHIHDSLEDEFSVSNIMTLVRASFGGITIKQQAILKKTIESAVEAK